MPDHYHLGRSGTSAIVLTFWHVRSIPITFNSNPSSWLEEVLSFCHGRTEQDGRLLIFFRSWPCEAPSCESLPRRQQFSRVKILCDALLNKPRFFYVQVLGNMRKISKLYNLFFFPSF